MNIGTIMQNEKRRELVLNFLPINKKPGDKFSFDVWCLPAENDTIPPNPPEARGFKKYRLPAPNGAYRDYWVSFKEFENSAKQTVFSNDNIELTKFYLCTLLKQKLEALHLNLTQREKEKIFSPYHLYIKVEETKYGSKTIRFEAYYLKIKKLFGYLVDYKFLKKEGIRFDREIQKLSFSLDENYRSNTSYHIDKYRYITRFLEQYLFKSPKISADLSMLDKFANLDCKHLKLRKYVFKDGKEDNSQFNGISKYGPYKFADNEIKYLYIYHEDHKDYANALIKALNGESFETFKGLHKFGLPLQTKENTRGIPLQSFDEALENHLEKIENNSIIIAVFPANEEKFYYRLKSLCLKKDIPVQTVHVETIIDENKLKWSTSGIALQILSKSGGIPWLVKTENETQINDCLIVGIGQSIERNDANKIQRFFAYSVLLDTSGKFLTIEPLSENTDKDQYLQILGKRILDLVEKYSEYKKIVFHVPEKVSREFIQKIERALKDKRSDAELYILRVNDDSKFFGYNKTVNSLIPYESSYIKLSPKEFLLWTEGLNYHNPTPRKRYGNPIYVDFYYSNQENINYESFLQDILNLSGTNYRGFNAKALPVSMFYPKLISNFYKFFNKYRLSAKIERKEKMWFL